MAKRTFDIIIIGGGHAGCEASLASARLGLKTCLLTIEKENIGMLSCNPAIGGIGKGQLVREIDALGGEIGKAADHGGIQFRLLNASKGAAARSSRAQEDRNIFKAYMQNVISKQTGLYVLSDTAEGLIVKKDKVCGVKTIKNGTLTSDCVVIACGTFMNAVMHIGLKHFSGGRIDEPADKKLSKVLKNLGFKMKRFKTGTCARLDGSSIDFSVLEPQYGDKDPLPFSFSTKKVIKKQVPCYITYTNEITHRIIRENLDRSPLYSGKIGSTGVRYCPSIEDKVVRFPDRTRHQVFLEPEGLDTSDYYPNGLSTSLPRDVQEKMLRSVKGLENVKVVKWGYGIEYDLIDPTQLLPTLESKIVKNLYFAGQINGTTGYEEAAAQGIVSGINAALKLKNKPPLILDRSSGYIGVLIDDLVTKGTEEPYRMFTSRVEYRLLLREDNADLRLSNIGFDLGLVSKRDNDKVGRKSCAVNKLIKALKSIKIKPDRAINKILKEKNVSEITSALTARDLLKRPGMDFEILSMIVPHSLESDKDVKAAALNEIKYAGYIKKQMAEVSRFKNLEKIKIPEGMNYEAISGLSREIKEKLSKARPFSLGQASRISGITPVAISIIMVHLRH